uniref:Inositol hexakisphosphate and diphosphoinositol-pentakisphosphate kinase n=1 Tax=Lygus hesperus TaxID=30085 RepID=A0A0A9X1W7_LYGHE
MLLSNIADNATVSTTLESLELNYLSHGAWRLYEDLSCPPNDPYRFTVSFMFSPGAALEPFIFVEDGHLLPVSRPTPITSCIPFDEFKARFANLDYHVDNLAPDFFNLW